MLVKKVRIINELGLHVRASSKLCDLANRFYADIKITKQNRTISAKSIMGVMTLAAVQGTELELSIEGEDEAIAMAAIVELIENKFGEAA